jgi:trigger factor
MPYNVNVISNTKQEIVFDIPQEELKPHFEKEYITYKNKTSIPGFRKGKAPLSMIMKMYGEAIEYESLEKIANEFYKNYLEESKVNSIGTGKLIDMDYKPKGNLSFKVEYEVMPELVLKDYKGIEVTKPIYEVNDKIVNDEIEYLKAKNCKYEEVQEAIGDENVVTFDIQMLDNASHPIVGQHDKGTKIYLKDKELNIELKKQIENIKLNEERFVKIPIIKDEKETIENYRFTARKIEKVIYPELNEDFFKLVSKKEIKDEAEFRQVISEDLDRIYKNMSDRELRNNIISELIKLNEIDVPEVIIERTLSGYIEELKEQNPKRELPENFNEEDFKKEKRVDAILQAKWFLISEKIVDVEKIEVSDEEIENIAKIDAERFNMPLDKVIEVYKKNSDLTNRLLNDKVMNFLIENNNIKEIKNSDESEIVS